MSDVTRTAAACGVPVDVLVGRLGESTNTSLWHVTAEESDRARRFVSSERRYQYLLGRHLLRVSVSRRCHTDPRDVLVASTVGPPILQSAHGHASIAHDREVVVTAAAGQAVGIDVMTTHWRDWQALEGWILADRERHALPTGSSRSERVRDLWVVKEAWLKCLGVGLAHAMSRVTVRLVGEGDELIEDEVYGAGRARAITMPGASLAVAVCGDEAPDVHWEWVPSSARSTCGTRTGIFSAAPLHTGGDQFQEGGVAPTEEVATPHPHALATGATRAQPGVHSLRAGGSVRVAVDRHDACVDLGLAVPACGRRQSEVGAKGRQGVLAHVAIFEHDLRSSALASQVADQFLFRPQVARLGSEVAEVATRQDHRGHQPASDLEPANRLQRQQGSHAVAPDDEGLGGGLADGLDHAVGDLVGRDPRLGGSRLVEVTPRHPHHGCTGRCAAEQPYVGGDAGSGMREHDQTQGSLPRSEPPASPHEFDCSPTKGFP